MVEEENIAIPSMKIECKWLKTKPMDLWFLRKSGGSWKATKLVRKIPIP